jgi:hypothetical protein
MSVYSVVVSAPIELIAMCIWSFTIRSPPPPLPLLSSSLLPPPPPQPLSSSSQ